MDNTPEKVKRGQAAGSGEALNDFAAVGRKAGADFDSTAFQHIEADFNVGGIKVELVA